MFDQVCVCVLQVIGNSRPGVSYNSGLLFVPVLHLGFLPGLTTELGTSWRDGARQYPPIEVATNAEAQPEMELIGSNVNESSRYIY